MASAYILVPLTGSQVNSSFTVTASISIDIPYRGVDSSSPPPPPPPPPLPPPPTWRVTCQLDGSAPQSQAVTTSGLVNFSITGASIGMHTVSVNLFVTPSGGTETLVAADSVSVEVVGAGSGTGVGYGSTGGVTPPPPPPPPPPPLAPVAPPPMTLIAGMPLVVGTYEVTTSSEVPLIETLRVEVFTLTVTYATFGGIKVPIGKTESNLVEFTPLFHNGQWVVFLDPAIDYTAAGTEYLIRTIATGDMGGVLSQTMALLRRVLWIANMPM